MTRYTTFLDLQLNPQYIITPQTSQYIKDKIIT